LNENFKLKDKLFFIISMIIIISFSMNSSSFLKQRYIKHLATPIINQIFNIEGKKETGESLRTNISTSLYYMHYQSGISVFKNYLLFGVGNKNYRVITCDPNKQTKNYLCTTHPHQIYFEFLAEHGLVGSIILFFIFFNLIFNKLGVILRSKNYIQIGSLIFLFTSFTPLLPSGAFFGDFTLTLFWINLCLMYSVEKKTNIYLSN
ncbi:O-antigen ligase family protein, partial [Candidatus Pelagibacter sp.]|nr:O-antigen ligase family protein [Candidatus Pelagibacter sp.]